MKIKEVLLKLNQLAIQYETNLKDKNIMFIAGSKDNPTCLEVEFKVKHFQHLTGLSLNNNYGSKYFYSAALKNKMNSSQLVFHPQGTTRLKLLALPDLIDIHQSARYIGDYNKSKPQLKTEKIAGCKESFLGFIKQDEFYVPNSTLKDRKENISTPLPVIAILRKNIKDTLYKEITYLDNNVKLEEIEFPEDIVEKMDSIIYPRKIAEPVIEEQLPSIDDLIAQAITQADEYNSSLDITKGKSKEQDLEI